MTEMAPSRKEKQERLLINLPKSERTVLTCFSYEDTLTCTSTVFLHFREMDVLLCFHISCHVWVEYLSNLPVMWAGQPVLPLRVLVTCCYGYI